METVEVADILVYRAGSLHSFRGQRFVKDGRLEKVGTGFGIVKDGKLYRFRTEAVNAVTGEKAGSDFMTLNSSD